ncbi:NAD(+)/NADH kinase [Halobacteria archaeon AArc-curdl1]|uniref:NAD(+)/NADH kinase n=1 Tax=Natronosalvus hydrolyticus TaxID=2979988 RepID=A0AAP3E4Y1_9EURY|nr:NAD(+)/NADH kinase [Halobacteria archaeon AArc-curdl1]
MESTGWEPPESPVVGIVHEASETGLHPPKPKPPATQWTELPASDLETHPELDRLATAFESYTDSVRFAVDTPERVLAHSPNLVIAFGDRAISALGRATESPPPILPIETTTGLTQISTDALEAAVEALCTDQCRLVGHSVMSVSTATSTARAVFDVTLVSDEPAHISEYGVHVGDRSIGRFRADGVVAATPAGSHGYAAAASGPTLVRGTDALAVVPIAPFAVRTRHWVVPNDALTLTVERENDVVLCVDGRPLETIGPDSPVSIRLDPDSGLRTLETPENTG